jgi:site-specific recombinase XerD
MDIKKIQYLAGHEDARITLNIYAKVTNNQPGELAPDIIS